MSGRGDRDVRLARAERDVENLLADKRMLADLVVKTRQRARAEALREEAGRWAGSRAVMDALESVLTEHVIVTEPDGPDGPYVWCLCGGRSDELDNSNPGMWAITHLLNLLHAATVEPIRQRLRADADALRPDSDPDAPRVLYHWSPIANRTGIEEHGLVPDRPANDGSWSPPHVCLGDTPSSALALTHGDGPLDLWMVHQPERVTRMDDEWRTTEPVPAWWCATRPAVCAHEAQIRDLLEEREELLTEIRRLRMGNHPAGRALRADGPPPLSPFAMIGDLRPLNHDADSLAEALTERDAEHEGGA